MKKIIKSYRRWRYRRLYRKLFLLYTTKDDLAYNADTQARYAFCCLTGYPPEEFFRLP